MKRISYLFFVLLAIFTTLSSAACKCKEDESQQNNEVQEEQKPNFEQVGD
jgi:hypothetical protein